MVKRIVALLLVLFVIVGAKTRWTPKVDNARVAREDVVYVDSIGTAVYSPIFWQATGGVKSLVIQASDDSTAGFASDSAVVKIELLQVFDDGMKNVIVLPSRSHPDSSTYPYGSDFVLFDSLDIADMDTTAYWDRVSIADVNINGDTAGVYYNDSLSAVATAPGAMAYIPIVPDYSPGLVLKITGLTGNAVRGTGSRWVVRWYQEVGQPVFDK